MTEEEFNNINWPDEFYIEFLGGERQLFVSSQGVTWDPGANESDENEGRTNINCCWQKKSPSQRQYRSIQIWVDEINIIQSVSGESLWSSQT
ncbi:hypothetical protein [Marinomonas mediterranea]|uniref:hypothetical protein n=1 Tax=Marinomonas mediterranea TaxID=119864 RepID=UPI00234BB96B|nr:hypothetical protein [Marinomonas mediterranea]WCN09958.1 hypothetical protein GV055_14030 [Marinomonas mediterranea]